ncbi:hypothetical protein HQ590_09375 [bacterium]|nr:hypothetical protein [bacterium]
MDPLHLENDAVRLAIDPRTGAVLSLIDKVGGYDLIAEPRLADGFRLLLPLPDYEANYVFGAAQESPQVEVKPNQLVLQWTGPLQNERGRWDVDVTLQFELLADGVQFSCSVRNRTAHQLAEVWYALLGGLHGIGGGDDARETELVLPQNTRIWRQPIFRDFGNTRGQTLGTLGPEHCFLYPGFAAMPWLSLAHPRRRRAVYAAALEESPRVKGVRFALEPGGAEQRVGGNWLRPDEVDGFPLGLTMNWVHYPYTRPGETFDSAPVVVRFHEGGWRQAAALYRRWFDERYKVIAPGSTWIRRETLFLHTMFMLPEDNINLRFRDIPRWAQDAQERGIGHLMIAGWQIGGHDRGYPQYEPDPRLGTWAELAAGIKAAHDLGLRVSFFVNCQPVDMSLDWYRKELHQYGILDPHGLPYYIVNYWGMGTLSARNRFMTGTPFTEINPAHPEVRKLLIDRFRRLVEIGADGIHIDKFFQTPFDFSPRLKDTSPDRAHHEGILKFVAELVDTCRAINPEFCFSYEGGWDRLFPYADTLWWGSEDSALKAVFPQMAFSAGIEQPGDYNKVNRAVLYGDNLLLGPANYNRGADYPPMQRLIKYIAEITRIRRDLFDIVSLGERIDASDGVFAVDPHVIKLGGAFAASPDTRWSVFRDPRSGRRAIVLANLGGTPLAVTGLTFAEKPAASAHVHAAFQPVVTAPFPVAVTVPAEQVMLVVEG